MKLQIRVGALAPSLSEQLKQQNLGCSKEELKHWTLDSEAINRLRIRGVITDGEAHKAGMRLLRKISKRVFKKDSTHD